MSMYEQIPKDYSDGRTKQAFADSTDINKILKKAQKAGGLSHAMKYDSLVYGEFTGVDLLGHFEQVERAQEIFDALPSEIRSEFDQNAFAFAEFASNPENMNKLAELLPKIAEPGDFFPNPAKSDGKTVPAVVPDMSAPVVATPAAPVVPQVAAPAVEGGVS